MMFVSLPGHDQLSINPASISFAVVSQTWTCTCSVGETTAWLRATVKELFQRDLVAYRVIPFYISENKLSSMAL